MGIVNQRLRPSATVDAQRTSVEKAAPGDITMTPGRRFRRT